MVVAMKKKVLFIFVIFLLAFFCAAAAAQTAEEGEISLQQRFPTLSIREKYAQYEKPAFYRFSPENLNLITKRHEITKSSI